MENRSEASSVETPAKGRGTLKLVGLGCGGLLLACVAVAVIAAALGGGAGNDVTGQVAGAPTATAAPATTDVGDAVATEAAMAPTPTAAPVEPDVTPTGEIEPTPESPTPVPTVEPTPTPEPSPVPPPEPIQLAGTGSVLTDAVSLERGLGVITMRHDGGANFIIWLYDSQTGERLELLVNEIGSWLGSRAIRIPNAGSYTFEVQADGNWSIEVLQPSPLNAPVVTAPHQFSGTGTQAVYFLEIGSGLHRVSATHNGSANFIVWAYNSDASMQDLLFNEIGPFEGQRALPIGSGGAFVVFDIVADGDWTLAIE